MSADLLSLAQDVATRAYAPYSGFQIGCALETATGRIITGCNVENASYGLTICAERNAVFAAIAQEGPSMRIARMTVICLGQEFPPCGACRQVIAEFATADCAISFLRDGKLITATPDDLLPSCFKC